MNEDLDSVDSFEQKLKRGRRKRKFKDIDSKLADTVDCRKTKMILEFNNHESASVKSFAAKKRDHIKVTTRFLSGKMLMFAELLLMSFIYEVLETFCFPDEKVQAIFKKYGIKLVNIYHILTDTDSTSLKFLFIFDPNSETPKNKFREIIFEVITTSKIYKRFDSSHEFWDNFSARKEHKRKKLGYYEIEHIDNPCILTIAANPKEYFEMFEDENINKKHEGIKKGSSGLGFENFSQGIKSLNNFDTLEKPPADFKEVSRFTVKAGEMRKETVVKNKFSQINDKRFYFPDCILSLPLYQPKLKELNEF